MTTHAASARLGRPWCGVLAGPLFVAVVSALGARRPGYDPRRHLISSLAAGERGWPQRTNFVVAGLAYLIAARGLRRAGHGIASPVVSGLVGAAGVGLVGSGLFVTDPACGFPAEAARDAVRGSAGGPGRNTRAGTLHNLSAIPVFVGIPLAALVSAVSSARRGRPAWAGYSAASGLIMVGGFLAMGRAIAKGPPGQRRSGVLQRLSVVSGLGWLSALSWRATRS